MANLAIQGHATRGKEVIEILEMLGGVNSNDTFGDLPNNWNVGYYIFDGVISVSDVEILAKKEFKIYTLEEFLEKYPYKVGDKVIHDGEVLPIIGMKWDFSRNIVIYTMKYNYGEIDCYDRTWMRPYKEETIEVNKEFKQKYCIKCGSQRCSGEGEWLEECEHYKNEQRTIEEIIKVDIPKGYEFTGVDDDKQQVVFTKIQPKYPKTYKECCEVLGLNTRDNDAQGYRADLIICFQELLIARNAYWEIAGEEMGLGKPWEPDYGNGSKYKYTISFSANRITKSITNLENRILAFPTEEMRDAFYESFKDLINETKELL